MITAIKKSTAVEKMESFFECTCHECNGCSNQPGWWSPVDFMEACVASKMKPLSFFKRSCVLEFWVTDPKDIFIIAPCKRYQAPGSKAAWNHAFRMGVCIFYENGRCSIHHRGKPYECRVTDHRKPYQNPRGEIAALWKKFWQTHGRLLKQIQEAAVDTASR